MFKLNDLKGVLYVHKLIDNNMDIFCRSTGIENGGQY